MEKKKEGEREGGTEQRATPERERERHTRTLRDRQSPIAVYHDFAWRQCVLCAKCILAPILYNFRVVPRPLRHRRESRDVYVYCARRCVRPTTCEGNLHEASLTAIPGRAVYHNFLAMCQGSLSPSLSETCAQQHRTATNSKSPEVCVSVRCSSSFQGAYSILATKTA